MKESEFDINKWEDHTGKVEEQLKTNLSERCPKIPKAERSLEEVKDDKGRALAFYEKVRESQVGDPSKDVWVVVDFDDVLSHTTSFNDFLGNKIAEKFGISKEEYKKFYDNSKEENDFGKKVFRIQKLVEQVASISKDAPHEISKILSKIDYNQFIDQGVKRALQALKQDENIRVSILTFGDIKYQRDRISYTDLDDIVDDFIYTESSKRTTLETLEKEMYNPEETDKYHRPFIVTVDDSRDHVSDYEKLPYNDSFLNVQYNNPQAKRYIKNPQSLGNSIIENEQEPNEAAIGLWKAVRVSQDRNIRQAKDRVDINNKLVGALADFERVNRHEKEMIEDSDIDVETFIKQATY